MTIATDSPNSASILDEQRALRDQLARLRRRLRLQLALELAVDSATILVATAALLILLDWWLRLGLPSRLALVTISLGAALAFVIARAIRKWRAARLDDLSMAMILDRHRPGTGQRIADVLQLPDLLDQSSAAASPAMVRLAVRQASEALAASDWRSLWNRKRTATQAAILGVGLLIPILFATISPQAARLSFARWLLGSNERWPQQTYLTVMGLDSEGHLLVPRDERFALEVRSDLPIVREEGGMWSLGGRGESLTLGRKPEGPKPPSTVTIRERTAEGKVRDAVMVSTGPGRFRHDLPPSSTSSTFELVGGDDWLGPIPVDRVDRPSLAGVKLRVKEPGSAEQGFREIADPRQHLLFFPDTEVEMTLVGTEPLTETKLNVHPGKTPDLDRLDDRTFAAKWTLREATTLEVLLTSGKTGLGSKPAFFSIGLLKDREPRVTLRAAGVGARVTPVATIPLTLGATDDIGLAALRLKIDRTANVGTDDKPESKTRSEVVNFPFTYDKARPELDHVTRHDVVLQVDQPSVGTILRLVGEADDHNPRGVQTGRSGVIQLQVVSPDELFYELLIRQRAERAKFVAALESAEKQTPILASQASSEDINRVMRAEQAVARQLDQIAGRIGDTLQEMKLNQIGTAKSHRLLQDGVIDPIKALTAGPMNQLRSALQTLGATASASEESREAARKLHGEVVAQMKQILDQMSQWESFVDVVNQVAEVIKMQQKVLKATEGARESRAREVFDEKP
ncbi:hypothetical protein P12x_002025 [Tundrisphaera lichenicola]|uniref:hypothetical protein n=1 Tax=Tundrisphaera lichenicola TaxID=2029860 RepID=UPI003EC02990